MIIEKLKQGFDLQLQENFVLILRRLFKNSSIIMQQK